MPKWRVTSLGFTKVEAPAANGSGAHFTVQENDEAGQVDKVINYENVNNPHTVSYTFNQHGQPLQMLSSFPGGLGNATTTFAYDALGRRNSITDPSSGVNTFTFNSIGEMTRCAGPGGDYTFAYDQLGRMTNRTGSGLGSYTYSYVPSGNGIGQLQKIIGPTVLTEYTYDDFDRPIEKKESLGAGVNARLFNRPTATTNTASWWTIPTRVILKPAMSTMPTARW